MRLSLTRASIPAVSPVVEKRLVRIDPLFAMAPNSGVPLVQKAMEGAHQGGRVQPCGPGDLRASWIGSGPSGCSDGRRKSG
jgi:hypothetical protein